MALLKITPYGDSLLRKQSEPVDEIDDEIRQFISDMSETMEAAEGVGLASPQAGKSKMLFLIDWSKLEEDKSGSIKAYVNPEIISKEGKIEKVQEGCLSLPEVWADVDRPEKVKVKYQDIDGNMHEEELTGMPARVFQHEFDHLIGILFIDRISKSERKKIKGTLQAIMDGRIKPFDGSQKTDSSES